MTLLPFPAGTVEVDDRHLHRAAGQVAGWELRAGDGIALAVGLYVGPGDGPPRLRIHTTPAGTPMTGIVDPDQVDALADLLAAAAVRLDVMRRPPLPVEPAPPPVAGQGALFG